MREELHAVEKVQWKPSRLTALKTYNISIKFLDRGVVVTVGCREIAYESVDVFISAFNEYMIDPVKIQESWLKEFDKNE